jgi:hypothetical protein
VEEREDEFFQPAESKKSGKECDMWHDLIWFVIFFFFIYLNAYIYVSYFD